MVKGHQVHFIVVVNLVFMFASRKKVHMGFSISANSPGLNVPDLQSIYRVTKGDKRSLGVFKAGDFIYTRQNKKRIQ